MHKKVYSYLFNYSSEPQAVDRLIVSAFLDSNNLEVVNNNLLTQYVIQEQHGDEFKCLAEFKELVKVERRRLTIEDLIELFEFVISPLDKEVNGAVYTPEYIRTYIVKCIFKRLPKDIEQLSEFKFGDISCGCAGFLYTITEYLKSKTQKSYCDIYKDNIYGLDIKNYSVTRSKLLLSLLAVFNGEDVEEFKFNLFEGNALSFNWAEKCESIALREGFDVIVGNPPYVGSSKIDEESKSLLKNWEVTKTGKADLYIPFFEIALENLNANGFLGYITVNTFYRSLNGRALRRYFSWNRFDIQIIDFEKEQLFKGRSTYTCICIIGKQPSEHIKYIKSESDNILKIRPKDYIKIKYGILNDYEGWLLVDNETRKVIQKIITTGAPLGNKFDIRNGFATLKNSVYVFKPISEDEEYFYLEKKGNIKYKIEKNICRNAIKPNVLKSESEIQDYTEKIIFPYHVNYKNINLFEEKNITVKIFDEKYFKSSFPCAYKYLLDHQDILAERDKGEREYEKWFSYGRSQALTYHGYKLFFPYISETPRFVFSEDKDFLFYNGYAVFSNDCRKLLVLRKILKSKIFWFYVKTTSKPYEGGFFSLAKNYIKGFGVCNLTKEEEEKLLKLKDNEEIDNFLIEKYGLSNWRQVICDIL